MIEYRVSWPYMVIYQKRTMLPTMQGRIPPKDAVGKQYYVDPHIWSNFLSWKEIERSYRW